MSTPPFARWAMASLTAQTYASIRNYDSILAEHLEEQTASPALSSTNRMWMAFSGISLTHAAA